MGHEQKLYISQNALCKLLLDNFLQFDNFSQIHYLPRALTECIYYCSNYLYMYTYTYTYSTTIQFRNGHSTSGTELIVLTLLISLQ